MNPTAKGLLLTLTTMILWGVLPLALEYSNQFIDNSSVVWVRFFVASLVLGGSFAWKRDSTPLKLRGRSLWLSIIAACCLAGNFIAYMKGLHLTTPTVSQILGQIGPLILVVVSLTIFKERLSAYQKLGFAIAAVGFLGFYWDQFQVLDASAFNHGVFWIVVGAISWAVFAAIQRVLIVEGTPSSVVNLIVYAAATLIFTPMCSFSALLELNTFQWLFLISLGFNTLIAYGCLGAAFRYIEANVISILITLNPVFTILSVAILHHMGASWVKVETVSLIGVCGAGLVLLGAVLVSQGRSKKPTEPKPISDMTAIHNKKA